MLRRGKVHTTMGTNDSCASACVFAFLGGIDRSPLCRIGLHRAYAASPSNPSSDDKEEQSRYYDCRIDVITGKR
jgi:hypothetical protein